MSTWLGVPADKVWDLVGGFNALADWHPAIEKSELEGGGEVRKLSLAGGGTIVEKLEHHSDTERTYTYTITDSPLPVADYTATLTVRDEGQGSTVKWSSDFAPSGAASGQVAEVIQGIYQTGFDNLKKLLGG